MFDWRANKEHNARLVVLVHPVLQRQLHTQWMSKHSRHKTAGTLSNLSDAERREHIGVALDLDRMETCKNFPHVVGRCYQHPGTVFGSAQLNN